jgi:hypothetical protein
LKDIPCGALGTHTHEHTHTHTHTHTHARTNGHTDRQTLLRTQADRQTDRHTHTHAHTFLPAAFGNETANYMFGPDSKRSLPSIGHIGAAPLVGHYDYLTNTHLHRKQSAYFKRERSNERTNRRQREGARRGWPADISKSPRPLHKVDDDGAQHGN